MKLSFYTIKQYENAGYEVPEYVKTASVDELSSNKLDSRANIWMHALNYYTTDNIDDKISMNLIEKRANYFGNKEDINELNNAFCKIASDTINADDFAIASNGIYEYPVRSREEWQAANEFLHKNASVLPKQFKTRMAAKLLQKAAEFFVSVNDENSLMKFASLGLPLDDSVISQLYRRSELFDEPELVKLAEAINLNPESLNNVNFCDKLVDFIQDVDTKHASLFPAIYDDGYLLPPDDAVYTVSLKQAADLVDSVVSTKTGSVYSKDQLKLVKYAELKELFGDDVASEVYDGLNSCDVDKLADVIQELPLPDAEVFDVYMKNK